MREDWKDIPDFPNYQVSNLGRVRSKDWILEFVNFKGTKNQENKKGNNPKAQQ